MTVQHVAQIPAVTDDSAIARQVQDAVDDLATHGATRQGNSLGVTPPSDDPGWELLLRIDADGVTESLVWVLVTETES